MKCWRSTRARVERSMMVVHMVPRAHHPAAKETARSTWTMHGESTHHSSGDLFVSLSLTLPGWIGNIGGLVNPRLEKMTWCITEAQHCCTPKLRYDEWAFVAHDSDIYCIISKEERRAFFDRAIWDIFASCSISPCCNISCYVRPCRVVTAHQVSCSSHLCLILLIIHLVLYIINLTTALICQTVWCATEP